jgi:hypothetical protein
MKTFVISARVPDGSEAPRLRRLFQRVASIAKVKQPTADAIVAGAAGPGLGIGWRGLCARLSSKRCRHVSRCLFPPTGSTAVAYPALDIGALEMGAMIALLLLQGLPADGVADEDDLPDDAGEIIDGDTLA